LQAKYAYSSGVAGESLPAAPGLLLRRQCACGEHTGGGSCAKCGKGASAQTSGAFGTRRADSVAGGDLSGVPSYTIARRAGPDDLLLSNGPDSGAGSNAPPARPQARAGSPASCPADIKVGRLVTPTDTDFGKDGPITGWGGYSRMDVSDSTGRDWAGTEIHEALTRVKNTCGDQGNLACSNT